MSADQEIVATGEPPATEQAKVSEVSLAQFLEEVPPDTYVKITGLKMRSDNRYVQTPLITLFCENESCDGPRLFGEVGTTVFRAEGWRHSLIVYRCRNCGKTNYSFSIYLHFENDQALQANLAVKLGQIPAFGPKTPARLLRLIQPHLELFLQGRRAENKGLGIGAFAYYRRVVENEKNRIIGEIARVSKTLGSNEATAALFAEAQRESSFAKSVEKVKHVIPQTLLINGQNPLTLLHTALSKGLHDPEMTDEHCLKLAQSIRTILVTLTEKAAEALKNDKEIQTALNTLMAVPTSTKASR